ncbi:MAG TPA: hypothetical protein VK635_29870 [Bradyrhizobium sp.]|nr:hypothetical protein [Bradyrhizobium sp.]
MTQDVDALALAFLERETVAAIRSYLGSGRRFQSMNKPDLYMLWAAAFIDFWRGDRARLRDFKDLGVEIELRNLQKPVELVCEKLELARQRRKETRESNPELFEDLKEAHHLSAD